MSNRYFVLEHATGTVRAAQSTLKGALAYSTPDRIIAGPMSVDDFHRLFTPGRPAYARTLTSPRTQLEGTE